MTDKSVGKYDDSGDSQRDSTQIKAKYDMLKQKKKNIEPWREKEASQRRRLQRSDPAGFDVLDEPLHLDKLEKSGKSGDFWKKYDDLSERYNASIDIIEQHLNKVRETKLTEVQNFKENDLQVIGDVEHFINYYQHFENWTDTIETLAKEVKDADTPSLRFTGYRDEKLAKLLQGITEFEELAQGHLEDYIDHHLAGDEEEGTLAQPPQEENE